VAVLSEPTQDQLETRLSESIARLERLGAPGLTKGQHIELYEALGEVWGTPGSIPDVVGKMLAEAEQRGFEKAKLSECMSMAWIEGWDAGSGGWTSRHQNPYHQGGES
jgi:hypothetical protein